MSACFLVLASGIAPASACTKNNHVRPAELVADEAHQLIEAKNYKKLDALYEKYSRKRTRTQDGVAELSSFFSGIAQSFNVVCVNAEHSDKDWQAHEASLKAWVASSPTSMGAKLALALFATDYAWYARGAGYASTVSDESMSLFKQRMETAKQQFEQLAGPGKHNPAWYEGMLRVGLAQGWAPAQFDALYGKAAKLDPYYLDIHYTNREFHASRWYGSEQQELNAIDRAARLTKPLLGETMYTRLHWTSATSTMYDTGRTDWKRMKTGFEDSLRIAPDLSTKNNYAKHACMAQDKPTLTRQLALMGSDLDPKKWKDDRFFAYCTAYAKLSGPEEKPKCYTRGDTGAYFCE